MRPCAASPSSSRKCSRAAPARLRPATKQRPSASNRNARERGETPLPFHHRGQAKPQAHSEYHERILAAVHICIPVEKMMSIDELACKLRGKERQILVALDLAIKIKRTIRERVGECLRCSIGLAPNVFLGKGPPISKNRTAGAARLHPHNLRHLRVARTGSHTVACRLSLFATEPLGLSEHPDYPPVVRSGTEATGFDRAVREPERR
jgi:hypothetical protein